MPISITIRRSANVYFSQSRTIASSLAMIEIAGPGRPRSGLPAPMDFDTSAAVSAVPRARRCT